MTLNDINVTFTVLLFSLKRQDMFLYNFICNDVNCFFILILAEILSAIHRQVKRQLSQVQEVATEVQSWTISTPAGGKCAKILICHGRNSSNPAKQFIWVFICWCVMFVYIYIYYIYIYIYYIYIYYISIYETLRNWDILQYQRYANYFRAYLQTPGCQASQRSGAENGAGGRENPKRIIGNLRIGFSLQMYFLSLQSRTDPRWSTYQVRRYKWNDTKCGESCPENRCVDSSLCSSSASSSTGDCNEIAISTPKVMCMELAMKMLGWWLTY